MINLPAAVERRRHSVIPPPKSDRQTASPTMLGVEGSPAPAAPAPMGDPGAEKRPATDRGRGRWVPGLRRCAAVGRRAGRPDRRRHGGGGQLGLSQHVGNEFRSMDIDCRAALVDALDVALGDEATTGP